MPSNKKHKSCFVPTCTNTSFTAPNKRFVSVPTESKRRKAWFEAVERALPRTTSNYFCCEDHFIFREDLENYYYYSMMGGPVKMKPAVVPHIFQCHETLERNVSNQTTLLPKKSRQLCHTNNVSTKENTKKHKNTRPKKKGNTRKFRLSAHFDDNQQDNLVIITEYSQDSNIITVLNDETNKDTISYRHEAIQAFPSLQNVACSPIIEHCSNLLSSSHSSRSDDFNVASSGDTNNTSCSIATLDICEYFRINNEDAVINLTNPCTTTNPEAYKSILQDWVFLTNYLSSKTDISVDHIKLTLMKIKTNDSFQQLSDEFSMLPNDASEIFDQTVRSLAHVLKPLIFFPDEISVEKNLPIPFRAHYSHIRSIIYCHEIQIETPTHPLFESLTWSESNKMNSLKYLISCTPDGFINFLSQGFAGRITDELIFQESGLLDNLPGKCGVMAAVGGFERIQKLLDGKECILEKPPVVAFDADRKPSTIEEGVASLRLHVERVIQYIGEFDCLKPDAIIHHNMLTATDDIMCIVCALINLQTVIIKA